MSIQLVALDMDGTLLNEEEALTPGVAAAVRAVRATGVRVVLASGRPLPGIMQFLPTLNLVSDNDYAIPYNGALVQTTASGTILSEDVLTLTDYTRLAAAARAVGLVPVAEDQTTLYVAAADLTPTIQHEAEATSMTISHTDLTTLPAAPALAKIMFFAPDKRQMDTAMNALDAELMAAYYANRSEDYLLEFVNHNASKGAALRKLAAHLGLAADQVMAMGDSGNDASMFAFAGTSIAMGNARQDIKDQATAVTLSNREDGVAVALQKYVLDAQ